MLKGLFKMHGAIEDDENSKVSCLPVALDLHLHPCHLRHHLAPVIDSEN